MVKVAKKNQVKKNTYTTVVVNNTNYDLELHEETICESKKLQVLKSKSQVKEGNINDEQTRESHFCEVKIMDNTDETYKVSVKKHQPMRQISIPRHELINNQQITIHYDEKQRYVDVVIWIKEIWICIAYNLLLTLQLSLNIFNAHMGFTCAHVAKIINMNCLEMVYKVVRCESDAK